MNGMSGDERDLFKDKLNSAKDGGKSWLEKIKLFEEKPYLISLIIAGVFLIGTGALSAGMIADQASDSGVEIVEIDEEQDNGEIYVDVGGAVIKPGLYKLTGVARVNDALVAAEGLSEKADRDWLAQNMNLAAKLEDGVKIYIPFKGVTEAVSQPTGVSSGEVAGTSITGKINVNTASSSQLDTLWGVGPVTAEKIISGRPYASVEELKSKKVLKSNVYERIKDEVSVY